MDNSSKNIQDEIDITALIKFLVKGINNFFNFLLKLLILFLIKTRKFFIQKFLQIVIAVFIGGLLGYLSTYFLSANYKVNLTLESRFLTGFNFKNEINKLNEYLSESNHEKLSEIFGIPKEKVTIIKNIKVESFYKYYDVFDKYGEIDKIDSLAIAAEMNSTEFVLELSLKSDDVLDNEVESWLKKFLERNPVLNKNFETRKKNLINKESKLKEELLSLDSLKQGVNKLLLSSGDNREGKIDIYLDESEDILSNPLKIYDKELQMFQELQSVSNELGMLEKVKIINGIKKPKENITSRRIKATILGSFYGLLCFISFFLLKSLDNYLINYEKNI